MAPRFLLALALVAGERLRGAAAALALPLEPPLELLSAPCAKVSEVGEAALHRGAFEDAAAAFTLGAARRCGEGSALNNLAAALASLGSQGGGGALDVPVLCEALAAAQLALALEREQAAEMAEAIEEVLGPRRSECFEPPLGDERAARLAAALASPRARGRHVAEASSLCAGEGAVAVAPSELERARGVWTAARLRTVLGLFSVCGVVVLEGLLPTALLEKVASALQLRAAGEQAAARAVDAERRGRGRRESRLPLEGPFADEQLTGQPLLLGLLRFLVGNRAELDTFSVIESEPGSAAQPWHCDTTVPELGKPLPLAGAVAVVPLGDVRAENGATEFLMGSHVGMGDERFWAGDDGGDGASDATPRVALRARAGSVVLFDLRLRHRGGANRAAKPRSVLYMSYVQDWFRDATNFKERQTKAWDALPAAQRKLFSRLDARRYVQRLEESAGAPRVEELRSAADYAPGKLEL